MSAGSGECCSLIWNHEEVVISLWRPCWLVVVKTMIPPWLVSAGFVGFLLWDHSFTVTQVALTLNYCCILTTSQNGDVLCIIETARLCLYIYIYIYIVYNITLYIRGHSGLSHTFQCFGCECVFNTEINVTETSCISGWTAEKTIESLESKRQSDAHTQSIIFIFIYELSRRWLHAPPASGYANVSMGHTQTCSLPHLPLVLLSANYSWLLLINYLLINWPINQ